MTVGGLVVSVIVYCLGNSLYYLGYRHAVEDMLEQKGGPPMSKETREWLEREADDLVVGPVLNEGEKRRLKLAKLTAAYRKGLEDAAGVVREKCGPCKGTGLGGENERGPYECEYCGRPRDAIRALMEREES